MPECPAGLLYFVPARRGLVLQHLETQTFSASSISWHHGKIWARVCVCVCVCVHAWHPRVLTCALQRCNKPWLFLDRHNPPHKGMRRDMRDTCSFTTFCILLLIVSSSYIFYPPKKQMYCVRNEANGWWPFINLFF